MKKIILIISLLLIFKLSFSQNTDSIKIASFVNNWKGVPYKFGGSSKKGIDCSQFNKKLYISVYKKVIPNVCYKQWQASSRISKGKIQPGDLIFFKSKRSPSGWHCGCYIGGGNFVHSPGDNDSVKVTSIYSPSYSNRIRGFGRM